MQANLAIVAIGGNSLIRDVEHRTVHDQYIAARETCEHVVDMIADGWDVVIVHGNGPQVGFMLRRSELAAHELHEVPLDACGADTQGALGYALQQNLGNQLRRRGLHKQAVTVVTQTEVAADDPSFTHPTKPIGSFMDEVRARRHREEDHWDIMEDASRGWRRVVSSPAPMRIVELESIKALVDAGAVVVCAGGGGIPVVASAEGDLMGVAAVIDKDLSASLLATQLGAQLLLISTAVDQVALDFGTPQQRWVDRLSLAEAKNYLSLGSHFGSGSMAPKIQAVVSFLEQGGSEALITSPNNVQRALAGETGTRFTRE